MKELFRQKYYEYQQTFELMITYMYTDYDKYKEYADKAEEMYKELQEMQRKMKASE